MSKLEGYLCLEISLLGNDETQLTKLLNQSGLTTQIRTCPRATQQGHVKCRRHVTIPASPTQKAIPGEGGKKSVPRSFVLIYANLAILATL